jgi:glycosyltransferase involved in cell wall biosynthesis
VSGRAESPGRLSEIVVVIPAQNEEESIERSLRSVVNSAEDPSLPPVRIVLVLDSCVDNTHDIALTFPEVTCIEVTGMNVGRARDAGVRHALGTSDGDQHTIWVANTDADTTVSPEWLSLHARTAERGFDALIGAVVPDLRQLDEPRARAWHRIHNPGQTLGHVHGANFGVRASTYVRLGGFAPLTTGEDTEFVSRLRDDGVLIHETEQYPVTTSSRLTGRAAGGYAEYLTRLVP